MYNLKATKAKIIQFLLLKLLPVAAALAAIALAVAIDNYLP